MNIKHWFLLILSLIVISACAPATPVYVYVTPTHPSETPATGTPIAAASTATVVPPTAVPSTATGTPLPPTTTPIPPTSTSTATPVTPSVTYTPSITPNGPTPTFGSLVGPNATATTPPTAAPTTPAPTASGPTPTFGSLVGPNTTPYVPPTPIPPTVGPSPTPGPTSTGPTATFGAVIGPNYTPPPTFTPGVVPTLPPAAVTLPPAVTPGPSPTPGPVLRSDLMGIQIHGYLKENEWDKMLAYSKDLGMGWIKVQIQWKQLEPAEGVFNEIYSGMVLNIQRARLAGLRTLVSFAKAPDWARPASVRGNEDGPSDDPQKLANFIARFVRDTKPEFIDAIEVWNEPNLIREWRGKPLNGGEYMKYFNAAYTAIVNEQKAQPTNHRITVITAGPAPAPTAKDNSSLDDRAWLQQLYPALARYGSDVAVGAHPYGWANPPDATCCTRQAGITGWFEHRSFYFRNTLDDYRQIMVRNNHQSAKMWVTEFGWATYDGLHRSDGNPAVPPTDGGVGWVKDISQGQQASYVLRAFNMAQQPPYYDFLGPMMLWNLNFGIIPEMIDHSRQEAGFSLLDINWSPRPVYYAIKNAPKQTETPR